MNLSLILMNERSHNLRVVERAEIGIVMAEIIDLSFLITLCRFSHIKYVFQPGKLLSRICITNAMVLIPDSIAMALSLDAELTYEVRASIIANWRLDTISRT